MREMTLNEIQNLSLDIMQDIHEFCVENHIRYTLAYGTLIGAIRHKGFIPWDDDIDIIMPRDDWERFSKTFVSKRGYKILSAHDERNWQIYTRVYEHKTTLVKAPTDSATIELGLWVDVLPLDGLSNNKLVRTLNYYYQYFTFRQILNKRSVNKGLNLRNILGSLLSFSYLFSIHGLVERFHKRSIKHGLSESECCANLCCRDALDNRKIEILKSKDFSKYELTEFSGHEFYIASGYDSILRTIFGDYMKLPPKDKQVVRHGSFKYYIK